MTLLPGFGEQAPPLVHSATPGCVQVHARAIEPVLGGMTARPPDDAHGTVMPPPGTRASP
jgi:hypothetical protein